MYETSYVYVNRQAADSCSAEHNWLVEEIAGDVMSFVSTTLTVCDVFTSIAGEPISRRAQFSRLRAHQWKMQKLWSPKNWRHMVFIVLRSNWTKNCLDNAPLVNYWMWDKHQTTTLSYVRPEKMPYEIWQAPCIHACMHILHMSTFSSLHFSFFCTSRELSSSSHRSGIMLVRMDVVHCREKAMTCACAQAKQTQGPARSLESVAYHHTCYQNAVICPSVYGTWCICDCTLGHIYRCTRTITTTHYCPNKINDACSIEMLVNILYSIERWHSSPFVLPVPRVVMYSVHVVRNTLRY